MSDRRQLGARVDLVLYETLQIIAKRNARSLNKEVEFVLMNHVKKELSQKPEIQQEIQFK